MQSNLLKPLLEGSIKTSLRNRLSSVVGLSNPLAGAITWVVMKYIIDPVIDETYELVHQGIIDIHEKKKLREVNHAQTDDDFTDAFTNL